MDLKDIKNLISIVEKANISSFAIEENDIKIEIKKEFPPMPAPMQSYTLPPQPTYMAPPVAPQFVPAAGAAPIAAAAAVDSHLTEIKSPMVGTFYAASSPETPAFVKIGDSVSKGATLCIIEAMKLFNEIESEFSGTIEKILVKNGDAIEYGQTLFLIKQA